MLYYCFKVKQCFGFGCCRQQKRHAAAPPPAGVRRRMQINRQKLVGWGKGSLTKQQTEGTGTTTIQIRRKHNNEPHDPTELLSPRQDRCRALLSHEWIPAARRPPHRNPAWHHMVWNTRLCLAGWGETPPPSCATSWSPVKINPVLAKPRRSSWSLTKIYFSFLKDS